MLSNKNRSNNKNDLYQCSCTLKPKNNAAIHVCIESSNVASELPIEVLSQTCAQIIQITSVQHLITMLVYQSTSFPNVLKCMSSKFFLHLVPVSNHFY